MVVLPQARNKCHPVCLYLPCPPPLPPSLPLPLVRAPHLNPHDDGGVSDGGGISDGAGIIYHGGGSISVDHVLSQAEAHVFRWGRQRQPGSEPAKLGGPGHHGGNARKVRRVNMFTPYPLQM